MGFDREDIPSELRASISVRTDIPVRGKELHRIAAYRLSDVSRNMSIVNQGYDFDSPKLISRKSESEDPILEDNDLVSIHVSR